MDEGEAGKRSEPLTSGAGPRADISKPEVRPPTASLDAAPIQVAYARRDPDLDPQLVWRGKGAGDAAALVVPAAPLYTQERIDPKALVADLIRSRQEAAGVREPPLGLFADVEGRPPPSSRIEFYEHEGGWTNRMILGDSLHVMASLAERQRLRGKVQCVYFDPPYGIKFNSNFQWSTASTRVQDGRRDHIPREAEQVKAFRDTWRDGVHSYLSYLRDRLTAARDLLSPSGSIFVQMGGDNVHRVRSLLDEVFGPDNAIVTIYFRKTTTQSGGFLADTNDYILWYARDKARAKFRPLMLERPGFQWVNYDFLMTDDLRTRRLTKAEKAGAVAAPEGGRVYRRSPLTSTSSSASTRLPFEHHGVVYKPGKGGWKTNPEGLLRLVRANRIETYGRTAAYRRYTDDFPFYPLSNSWTDTASGGYGAEKVYVVQTHTKVVERCVLMATDPGDLVLDPTCGSGTTAYVAEKWGRRWVTMDTSRVSLALARSRLMGARHPYYLLADSEQGRAKEAALRGRPVQKDPPTGGRLRHGFVCERAPHVMLKTIAGNAEIDGIWERHEPVLEAAREALQAVLGEAWAPWEIPGDADPAWSAEGLEAWSRWWALRVDLQREIDESIRRAASTETLLDRPYVDDTKVRVTGPFTVESLSPHRTLTVEVDDEDAEGVVEEDRRRPGAPDFGAMIVDNLRIAGVQQAHKEDRLLFTSLVPWPGQRVCAEGRYRQGGGEEGPLRRAAIFVGPEFGAVRQPDLVEAAREAEEAGFDVLVACAFNYGPHTAGFDKLGSLHVMRARMNADLHMAADLKRTDKGNLFVVFGEPEFDVIDAGDGAIRVRITGVDVFKPRTGEVVSDSVDNIACWFIDTDYDEDTFFARHAYFLGAKDPYKALRRALKADIDEEAWGALHSDTSRPFGKPASGRIAVKVINHLGDEVMKVVPVP